MERRWTAARLIAVIGMAMAACAGPESLPSSTPPVRTPSPTIAPTLVPETPTPTPTPSPGPADLYLVTAFADAHLVVLDPERGEIGRIEVGRAPWGVAVAPDGLAYVATLDGVAVVDVEARERIGLIGYASELAAGPEGGEYRAGGLGIAVSPDGRRVYVGVTTRFPDPGILEVINTTTRSTIASVPVGIRQFDVVVSADGVVLEWENEEISHVYFPVTGIASLLAVGVDGETVDSTIVGREGVTGLAVFLGTGQMPVRTAVQISLTALRLPSRVLRGELQRGGHLVDLLHRYTQVVMVSMAQLILCNRAHSLERRVARWLLQVHERVDEQPFDVTQEFLSEMVGAQRPSVSVVVRQFKDQGLVAYTRGKVRVTDADAMLAAACSCITIMHAEEERLRATGARYRLNST